MHQKYETDMKPGKIIALAIMVMLLTVGIYIAYYDFLQNGGTAPVITYAADAYVGETNYLLQGFHNSTGIGVAQAKGGGSYTDAREIAQGAPANVFVSVALNAYDSGYLGNRYSGWAVAFASDQLVLAYSNSTHPQAVNSIVDEINLGLESNNSTYFSSAFVNLTSGNVKVGISDPNSDPAGLRGWISLEIAGYLYGGKDQQYFIKRIDAKGGNVSGPNAAELVAPLTSGDIQFLFIYKSAAIAHGLSYVSLPDVMNFGNASLSGFYSGFSLNTTAGVVSGSSIFLFISALAGNGLISNSSLKFVQYVILNNKNLSKFGMTPLSTCLLFNDTSPPNPILSMISRGKLRQGGSIQ